MKRLLSTKYIRYFALYTAFCLCCLFIRNLVVDKNDYNFLLWNLFLGFLPFMLALVLQIFTDKINTVLLLLVSFIWLLFYPNAPYMITDLIHVNQKDPAVLYDAVLIFSFAMLSLFFGFYSLKIMKAIFIQKFDKRKANVIIFVSVLLSSFGIYLGRILRLNSWDVFSYPFETICKIFEHLFPISSNPGTYVIIIGFTIVQLLLLSMISEFDEKEYT